MGMGILMCGNIPFLPKYPDSRHFLLLVYHRLVHVIGISVITSSETKSFNSKFTTTVSKLFPIIYSVGLQVHISIC